MSPPRKIRLRRRREEKKTSAAAEKDPPRNIRPGKIRHRESTKIKTDMEHSIDVGAGVIDADYRGPVGVILFNYSDVDFELKIGDCIAQLIIEKIITPDVLEVEDLDSTVRGAGGFGPTGV
ncbi:deoxyuridine 5'-triphosphate nucleotidohydrolase-like [Spinacia oleracea]|uniref:Deoxyuridine 5'-triphosphate nucleotidohydrolase n=1 Tax=Spinacia oleracea TaxID=3562 RepID=A0ABM3RHY3_SPIOL|nr:deoxyuridine 5'-triphosphate nucleotidohydrolase-like [Spinacia oleracea]